VPRLEVARPPWWPLRRQQQPESIADAEKAWGRKERDIGRIQNREIKILTDNMNKNITRKLAGIVALLSGGSLSRGAVIAKRRAPRGGNVASVFVTNGGYNGLQQVLRLTTCFRQRRPRSEGDECLSQNGENQLM
jgi:hypothetical protein